MITRQAVFQGTSANPDLIQLQIASGILKPNEDDVDAAEEKISRENHDEKTIFLELKNIKENCLHFEPDYRNSMEQGKIML